MSCAEGVGQGAAAAGPRGGARVLNLDALIFWQGVIDEADPLEAPAAPSPPAQHLVLRAGSANVLAFHPAQEHLQGGGWLPSERWRGSSGRPSCLSSAYRRGRLACPRVAASRASRCGPLRPSPMAPVG